MNHTPGPWTARPCVFDAEGEVQADVHDSQHRLIAECGAHEDSNANARLVSAAPELLEASKAAADELSEFMPMIAGDVITMLEAAIAKAMGAPTGRAITDFPAELRCCCGHMRRYHAAGADARCHVFGREDACPCWRFAPAEQDWPQRQSKEGL